ncbi:MAG: class I SAM-dependent methyltransferase [Patescibacteria group bacterium]|nr:class I SAM-dependent methyltransferase [Patescibacteria group bacterium]MCX7928847.1 class I SAM-dependent methyltransferase [Patescibacteria group bacterium]
MKNVIKFSVNGKNYEFLHPFRVDLACGQNKTPNFFGVDKTPTKDVDMVWDLEKYPWPFPDNSIDEAICSHYIEHTSDIIAFMEEVYRVLVPGGQIKIIAPYYNSIRAWQDPTHKRAISEATFLYFNKQWRKINKLNHYPIKCDFDFTYAYDFTPDWALRSEEAKAFAIRHYTNVINDIQVILTKR